MRSTGILFLPHLLKFFSRTDNDSPCPCWWLARRKFSPSSITFENADGGWKQHEIYVLQQEEEFFHFFFFFSREIGDQKLTINSLQLRYTYLFRLYKSKNDKKKKKRDFYFILFFFFLRTSHSSRCGLLVTWNGLIIDSYFSSPQATHYAGFCSSICVCVCADHDLSQQKNKTKK